MSNLSPLHYREVIKKLRRLSFAFRGSTCGSHETWWNEVEKVAKTKRLEKFWLDVISNNDSAIKLYEKLGFKFFVQERSHKKWMEYITINS